MSEENILASTFSQPMSRRTAIGMGLKVAAIGGTALVGATALTAKSALPTKAAAMLPKTSPVLNGLPAAAASGNRTVAAVTTPAGELFWTSWTLGGAGTPWARLPINGPTKFTNVAPAVSFRTTLGGVTVWIAIRDWETGYIFETLQQPDGSFAPWTLIPGIITNVSPIVSDGNLAVGSPIMVTLSAPPDGVTYINDYLSDQPPSVPPAGYWRAVTPSPFTTLAPALSIVGNQGIDMSLAASVINFSGPNNRLVLYQGNPYNPDQLTAAYMGLDSNVSPTMAAANNRTVIVAVDPGGAIFYDWWDLGGVRHGWIPLGTDVRTNVTPAVALVDQGNYMFIFAQGLDGTLWLNQGNVGGSIVGWR